MKITDLFKGPKIIGICGDINQAKSNLIYHMIESLKPKFKFKLFSYGLKSDFGEQKIYSVEELEVIKNSCIILDEFTNLLDVEDRKKRKMIEKSLRLIFHNNNILILSGNCENFKKFISAKLNIILFKKSTLSDFINGSRIKNVCTSYKGDELGSSVLDLEKNETILWDGNYYKIKIPYLKRHDSKKDNVQIFVPNKVQKLCKKRSKIVPEVKNE